MRRLVGRMNFLSHESEFVSPHRGARPQCASSCSTADSASLSIIADAALSLTNPMTPRLGEAAPDQELSPADILVRFWTKYGLDTPQYIFGDFVFAVLDRPARRVVLVRDHIGARSLYWARSGSTVTFGTSLSDMIACNGPKPTIDEHVVAAFLAASGQPLPKPFFSGIHAVQPGSLVIIDANGVKTRRWWNPPTTIGIRLPRLDDYVETMRELVDQAVRDCMQGARAVGAHVSGGIDSTGVGVLASRAMAQCGECLKGAYTWSPSVSELYPAASVHDERKRVVAAAGDVPVRFGSADENTFLAFLERPFELEGIADLADEIPMLNMAASDGIDVMLSGWGGDEAFSSHGLGYLSHLLLTLQPRRMAHFARSQLKTLRNLRPLAATLWYQAIYPLLPGPLYQRLSPYPDMSRQLSYMSPELHLRHSDEIAEHKRYIRFGPHVAENIKRHLLNGHIGMRMETWEAWSRPYGFRYRYPLVDRRILEFVMAIPPEVLFMGDRPRGLALAALDDVLPANVMKYDIANEQFRETTRQKAWLLIAERTRRGELLQRDCPWLDMPALRACALTPLPQNTGHGVLTFAELFTALRIWHLYQRHHPN